MASHWFSIGLLLAAGLVHFHAAEPPPQPAPSPAAADPFIALLSPGDPVSYEPFYPDRWQTRGLTNRLVPWTGQRLVFLTTNAALNPAVMGPFVRRLDAAWDLYADLTGRQPTVFRQTGGRSPVVAVPSPDLTCGYGCGFVGATGIEVGGFYDHDYPILERDSKAVPHYYFYELGRNFYTFGDRHSAFTTGFAVFMRYVCLDGLGCPDPDVATRKTIESAIGLYETNRLDFLPTFTALAGLDEKAPRLKNAQGQPIEPSDQPVLYASAMMRLHRECGGNDWLRRFFRQLATCPEVKPDSPDAARRQSLSWFVAAACAARRDLAPLFADRWRLPLADDIRRRLAALDWSDPERTATAVLERLDRPPGLILEPYLQPIASDSLAILWQTDLPAYGWVDYGPTETLGQRRSTVVHGLRTANVREHRVTLENLQPGTRYYYRVGFKPVRKFEPYKVEFGPEQMSDLRSFQTLPGPTQPLTAVLFNDLHNLPTVFRQIRQPIANTPFDFALFNGDCFTDTSALTEVLGPLAAYTTGVQAGSHPTLFLRGNHETRGAFARDLPRLFAWPENRPYFAFNAGPVRFLVLDCGEDKPDDNAAYSGLVDFDTFRREETDWLRRELASDSFRNATWRVLVSHMPLHTSPACQAVWIPLLANAHIDLALHGHTHRAAFHPPNTVRNPYPAAVGGAPKAETATVMVLEANPQRLGLRVLDGNGHEVYPPFESTRSSP